MAGVAVNGLDDGGGSGVQRRRPTPRATTPWPEDILVDDYTIVVDHFGYLHYEQAVFVNYGANIFDIDLDAGAQRRARRVRDRRVTCEPLQATVQVYRTRHGRALHRGPVRRDGVYTTGALPYFDYDVRVRAWHHVPVHGA